MKKRILALLLTAAMALGYADEAPGPRPRKSMDDLAAWRS